MVHRLITLSVLTMCTLSIHSINANSFQDPLIISLQKELRTPQYTREILPNDFSHLSELINFGAAGNQPPAYLRSIIKLFSNMLKRSYYVNASAFSQMLETLPKDLTPYFSLPASREYIANSALYDATFVDRFKATVQSVLYSKFSTEYESFRQDPDLFLKKSVETLSPLPMKNLSKNNYVKASSDSVKLH